MADRPVTPADNVTPFEREALSDGERTKKSASAGRKGFDPEMRTRLVDAACAIMGEEGADGVKARALATRAGIAVGSVYNLFADLDEVVRAANGRTYDDLYAVETEALETARAAGEDPREQMLALAHAYLEFVKDNQRRWQGVLSFNRRQTVAPPRWYLEKEIELFRIIERAIEPLPGAADPTRRRLTARALWASIHGIVTIAVANGFLMQPIEDVWEQIKIIVNAVAAEMKEIK